MDDAAIMIVTQYIEETFGKELDLALYDLFIVWKCKTLQNWKYLISTTLQDGMYYELTYNGDKAEWYLDAYKKVENKVINSEAQIFTCF